MVQLRLRCGAGLLTALGILGAAAVLADDAIPEQVLEKLGLKRARSTYSLEAESEVLAKRKEVQTLYSQWELAVSRQIGLNNTSVRMAQLNEMGIHIRHDLDVYNMTLEKMPHGGNNLKKAEFEQTVAERDQLRVALTELNRELDLLRSNPPTPKKKEDAKADVAQHREAHALGVRELRTLVDAILLKYQELPKDPQVQAALASIGQKTKTKMKVGPTAEFSNTVKYLEKAEKLAKPATFDLEDKPDSTPKKTSKSKRRPASK